MKPMLEQLTRRFIDWYMGGRPNEAGQNVLTWFENNVDFQSLDYSNGVEDAAVKMKSYKNALNQTLCMLSLHGLVTEVDDPEREGE